MIKPIIASKNRMNNGCFEKYFFNEKFRKLLVAINDNTVNIQYKQNLGG